MSMMCPPQRVKIASIPSAFRARATRWPPVTVRAEASASSRAVVPMRRSFEQGALRLRRYRLRRVARRSITRARVPEISRMEFLKSLGQSGLTCGGPGEIEEYRDENVVRIPARVFLQQMREVCGNPVLQFVDRAEPLDNQGRVRQ